MNKSLTSERVTVIGICGSGKTKLAGLIAPAQIQVVDKEIFVSPEQAKRYKEFERKFVGVLDTLSSSQDRSGLQSSPPPIAHFQSGVARRVVPSSVKAKSISNVNRTFTPVNLGDMQADTTVDDRIPVTVAKVEGCLHDEVPAPNPYESTGLSDALAVCVWRLGKGGRFNTSGVRYGSLSNEDRQCISDDPEGDQSDTKCDNVKASVAVIAGLGSLHGELPASIPGESSSLLDLVSERISKLGEPTEFNKSSAAGSLVMIGGVSLIHPELEPQLAQEDSRVPHKGNSEDILEIDWMVNLRNKFDSINCGSEAISNFAVLDLSDLPIKETNVLNSPCFRRERNFPAYTSLSVTERRMMPESRKGDTPQVEADFRIPVCLDSDQSVSTRDLTERDCVLINKAVKEVLSSSELKELEGRMDNPAVSQTCLYTLVSDIDFNIKDRN